MLMCHAHWRKVPAPIQRLVWRYYQTGQEIRKNPSAAYLAVQRMAVSVVLAKEGDTELASEIMDQSRVWAKRAGASVVAACADAMRQSIPPPPRQPSLFPPKGGTSHE